MKKNVRFLVLILVAQFALLKVNAQDLVDFEGLTYYLNKEEAFDAALEQEKQVLLFYGKNSCGQCAQVKKNLADASLKSILDTYYILWFCDSEVNDKKSPLVSDYLSHVTSLPLPGLCVINPLDITVSYGLTSGVQSVRNLRNMLTQYQTVDNDLIITGADDKPVTVFVVDGHLTIQNDTANEWIAVYSLTGSLVDRFLKTDNLCRRFIATYPPGIFLVNSSCGWTRKVVVRQK